jgi:hypothetical protein
MNNTEQSNQKKQNDNDSSKPAKKPNMLQVIGSVLAAGFGVQSRKNRERDFKQGSFTVYVIAGLIFTVLFILTLYSIVTFVLDQAK